MAADDEQPAVPVRTSDLTIGRVPVRDPHPQRHGHAVEPLDDPRGQREPAQLRVDQELRPDEPHHATARLQLAAAGSEPFALVRAFVTTMMTLFAENPWLPPLWSSRLSR